MTDSVTRAGYVNSGRHVEAGGAMAPRKDIETMMNAKYIMLAPAQLEEGVDEEALLEASELFQPSDPSLPDMGTLSFEHVKTYE